MSETHSSSVPRGRPARPPPRPSSRRPRSPRAVRRPCAARAAPGRRSRSARAPRTSRYQSEIYLAGMAAGVKPIFTTNLSDLEAAAAKVLSEGARRHLLAWAGGAAAVRANARALPRRGGSSRGCSSTAPSATSARPCSASRCRPRSSSARSAPGPGAPRRRGRDRPGGRGPGAHLRPLVAGEHVDRGGRRGRAGTGSRWFGLDWPDGDDPDLRAAPARARRGCTHLVLSPPQPGQGWTALAAIREAWDGPIVLGGIQTVPDARMAVRRGFDGIVVSNERGRRGRRRVGTIDVLPRIADAVGGKARRPVRLGRPHGDRRLPGAGPGGRGRPHRPPVRARPGARRGGGRPAHAPHAPRRARHHARHRRATQPPPARSRRPRAGLTTG